MRRSATALLSMPPFHAALLLRTHSLLSAFLYLRLIQNRCLTVTWHPCGFYDVSMATEGSSADRGWSHRRRLNQRSLGFSSANDKIERIYIRSAHFRDRYQTTAGWGSTRTRKLSYETRKLVSSSSGIPQTFRLYLQSAVRTDQKFHSFLGFFTSSRAPLPARDGALSLLGSQ